MSTLTLFFAAWYDCCIDEKKIRGMIKMNRTEQRKIVLLSFTGTGTQLSRKLCERLRNCSGRCEAYAPEKYAGDGVLPLPADRSALIGGQWGKAAFVFIGAAGIAVRCITPWVKDKYTDSPVLAVDEKGQYVIPLLAGHVGGAAALADEISELTGGTAVHTTATDVQGKFAVDVFAKEHHLEITDRDAAKAISAAVLEGEKIALYIEEPYRQGILFRKEKKLPEEVAVCTTAREAEQYRYRVIVGEQPARSAGAGSGEDSEGAVLWLRPADMAAGIGCRKGISPELLEQGFLDVLKESGVSIRQIKAVASIDLKKDEPALVSLAEKYRIPFVTYSADELRAVEQVSSGSEFVERVTGVDNVCERAAQLCCGAGRECTDRALIRGKCIREGMTAALAAFPSGGGAKLWRNPGKEPVSGGGAHGILIFAGTTEGRLLAEYASEQGTGCFVSVATEYGKSLVQDLENVTVLAGRMDERAIRTFIEENQIRLVIDATHPFAQEVTANIRSACRKAGEHLPVRYVRCLRQDRERRGDSGHPEAAGEDGRIICVGSVEEAVGFLRQTAGNIFIATGSRELHKYTAIEGYKDRCYARVLSVGPSVEEAVKLGFEGSRLFAMQGPFSREMNLALLHQTEAAYFVTKETGQAGGFEEKLEAAKAAGAALVVIGRPQEAGEDLETVKKRIGRR